MAWRSIESVIQTAEALCGMAGRHCADDRTGIGAPPTKILMVESSRLSSHWAGAREREESRTAPGRVEDCARLVAQICPSLHQNGSSAQILEMVELTRCVGKNCSSDEDYVAQRHHRGTGYLHEVPAEHEAQRTRGQSSKSLNRYSVRSAP
jgi:hypothetical protein